MPRKETIVPLDTPIQGHGGALVSSVKVMEPLPRDYFTLGEPQSYAKNKDDVMIVAENDLAIAAYMEKCIVEPDPLLVLNNVSLSDAMRLKAAVMDFFYSARLASAREKPIS